jgi:two-component system alkaline phosphatase synthesis response regulator PhoP/two-component system response regulator VicR
MLRGTSYLITEARGGYEGVEKARFDQPSLILLDISMPDRNGFEVLEDLKSDPATENIPVIFHTSRTFTAADLERTRGRHAGILAKQSDNQQEALAMIRKVLSAV